MPDLRELETLSQELTQIINQVEPRQILAIVAQKLGLRLKTDICVIIGFNDDSEGYSIGVWTKETESQSQLEVEIQNYLAKTSFISQKKDVFSGLVINNRQQESLTSEQQWVADILPVSAIMLLPTSFQCVTNGVILLGKSQAYQWSQKQQQSLGRIRDLVAIACHCSLTKQQLQLRSSYPHLCQVISQATQQNISIKAFSRLIIRETAQLFQAQRGLLLMLKYQNPIYKSRKQQAIPKAQVTITEQWFDAAAYEVTASEQAFRLSSCPLCEQAWQNAPHPLVIANQTHLCSNNQNLSLLTSPIEIHSSLFMPLIGSRSNDGQSGIILGFLVLQHNKPYFWQTEQLNLVNWVATQLSTAMLQDRTLSQVQSLVDERTSQLKWSLDVQAKLSDKMRQQIEELQRLNKLKDDFLTSMSHELNTPLTTMKMAIKMLRQPAITSDRQKTYFDILEQELTREYNLIQDILTLQKIESDQIAFRPQEINLQQLLTELATSFEEKWLSNKGINVKIDYLSGKPKQEINELDFTLYTDQESLQYIIKELLTNAAKYGDPDSTVEVEVKRQLALVGTRLSISISNYGAGIEPEEQEHIFDKFRRGQGVTDRAVPGTGLGLALVKSLIEHLNGEINCSSSFLEQQQTHLTCFTVTIPQLLG